jgi:tRNA (cytidine/uridine-2'-O-)-methyltransferase
VPTDVQWLVFGNETQGLRMISAELRAHFSDCFYQIPMSNPNVRSLNLANAASIVLYSQLARNHFFQPLKT